MNFKTITTMAKMIRHDFNAIHEALNEMIIAEVKAALQLLHWKKIEADGQVPLCRIVVSPNCDYSPRDMRVMKVWVDNANVLHIKGLEGDEDLLMEEYTENDDMLDIIDFAYLIDQIAAKADIILDHVLPNAAARFCGYDPELELKNSIRKLKTV